MYSDHGILSIKQISAASNLFIFEETVQYPGRFYYVTVLNIVFFCFQRNFPDFLNILFSFSKASSGNSVHLIISASHSPLPIKTILR